MQRPRLDSTQQIRVADLRKASDAVTHDKNTFQSNSCIIEEGERRPQHPLLQVIDEVVG